MGTLEIQFEGMDWSSTEVVEVKCHGTEKDPDKFVNTVRKYVDKGYIIQPKRDGMQCMYISGHGLTRNPSERYLTAQFPELSELEKMPSETMVIGEIICQDKTRSQNELGQDNCGMATGRQGLASPSEIKRRAEKTPCSFIIFDISKYKGVDVRIRTYEERFAYIKEIVGNINAPNIQAIETTFPFGAVTLRVTDRNEEIIERTSATIKTEAECIDVKLEGYIARDPKGNYATAPIKLKAYTEDDFVIVGWNAGKGKMSKTFGSLKLADPEGKPLLTSSGKPFTVSWKDKFNDLFGNHLPTPEQLEKMKNLFDSGTARARIVYALSTDPKSKIPRFPVLLDLRISADKHYESD